MELSEVIKETVSLRRAHNPITRLELSGVTRAPDRANRDAIAELQRLGCPIVSLGKGYFWATAEEARGYVTREKRRAITILQKIRHLDDSVNKAINQLEMFR